MSTVRWCGGAREHNQPRGKTHALAQEEQEQGPERPCRASTPAPAPARRHSAKQCKCKRKTRRKQKGTNRRAARPSPRQPASNSKTPETRDTRQRGGGEAAKAHVPRRRPRYPLSVLPTPPGPFFHSHTHLSTIRTHTHTSPAELPRETPAGVSPPDGCHRAAMPGVSPPCGGTACADGPRPTADAPRRKTRAPPIPASLLTPACMLTPAAPSSAPTRVPT